MSAKLDALWSSLKGHPLSKLRRQFPYLALLDVLAILAWASLLLHYWVTGKIALLLHPDYVWLTLSASLSLFVLGFWKGWFLLKEKFCSRRSPPGTSSLQHITLFPPGWGSGLLLLTAILGFLITPQAFASQTALQRGVTDAVVQVRGVPMVNEQLQPQAFHPQTRPETRSLLDWVKTLAVYPEPDAYTGQKVNVAGFVIHPADLSDAYLLVARFVITCCAADAYPVSLPVRLTESRRTYPPDTWVKIAGEMTTETLNGQRRLVIRANRLTSIPEPESPYAY